MDQESASNLGLIVLLVSLLGWAAAPASWARLDPCTPEQMRAIRADDGEEIAVECEPSFTPADRITKRLQFRGASANGAVIDCNHARLVRKPGANVVRLEVESIRRSATEWEVPQDITIRNCVLDGAIRVIGMRPVDPGDTTADIYLSSRCEEEPYRSIDPECRRHTSRVRTAAPRDITFDELTLNVDGNIPLYIRAGGTRITLQNSRISGRNYERAVYIGAESTDNVIRNNTIDGRLSVDASSHNLIVGNRFSSLQNGGIDLYRNCGEQGIVRHQAPQYNRIINNVFFYDRYRGDNPAIWLSSRNGNDCTCFLWWCGGRCYCENEDQFDFGSGLTNRDLARYNVVMDNRIVKRKVSEMIRADEWPNELHGNVTVEEDARQDPRPSDCYDFSVLPTAIVRHGESRPLTTVEGRPGCRGEQTCEDGILRVTSPVCPSLAQYGRQDFSCSRQGSNAGASCLAGCPQGQTVFAAKAACNLETTSLSRTVIDRQGWGTLTVSVASDETADGKCRLGETEISENTVPISVPQNVRRLEASCREHDKNGGDCSIAGTLICQGPGVAQDPDFPGPSTPAPRPPTRAACLAACDRDRDACMRDPSTRAPVCTALRTGCRAACPPR